MPMQRIPFPFESYQHPSPPLSAKRLVNLMAEQEPKDARTEVALVPTPGLQVLHEVGTGPIRAINSDWPGLVYFTSGDHGYRLIFATQEVQDLGYIGVPDMDTSGLDTLGITIAVGATGVVFCVPPNSFTCPHVGVLNQITDPAYPGAQCVTFLDGYFVFITTGDTGEWFISKLLDPSHFDALDFAFTDALPNAARIVVSHKGELWFFGEGGIEIWRDSGDQDFPFRRQAGGVIAIGSPTMRSVARIDESVWWVGHDFIVYRSNGYHARRVSTHAIEAIIRSMPWTAIVCALTYSQEGHVFYALTVGARTLVYDAATQSWHDRSSSATGNAPWRPISVSNATSSLLMGDGQSGKIFQPIPRLKTDDTTTLVRQFTTAPIWGGTNRAFCARVEIEMETGSPSTPGNVQLEWSNDSVTWTGSRMLSAGAVGDLRHRVYATRLGSFRQRVWRVTTHGVATYYAIDADLAPGAS